MPGVGAVTVAERPTRLILVRWRRGLGGSRRRAADGLGLGDGVGVGWRRRGGRAGAARPRRPASIPPSYPPDR